MNTIKSDPKCNLGYLDGAPVIPLVDCADTEVDTY